MVNVPSREAQARLVGVRSNLYEAHFRLVAEQFADPVKAYHVIERARGRAAADVLRALPTRIHRHLTGLSERGRAISRLQIRLMRARVPGEREQLLEQLWEAEQRTKVQGTAQRVRLPIGKNRLEIKTLQQQLTDTEIILEYVVTEPQSYCLVIGRRSVESGSASFQKGDRPSG